MIEVRGMSYALCVCLVKFMVAGYIGVEIIAGEIFADIRSESV